MKLLMSLFFLVLSGYAAADTCTVVIRDQYNNEYDLFTRNSYSLEAACSDASYDCRGRLSDYQSRGQLYSAQCMVKTIGQSYPTPYPPPFPPIPPVPPTPRYPDYPSYPDYPRQPDYPRYPDYPRNPRQPEYPRNPREPRYPDYPNHPLPPREPTWPREPGPGRHR